ncbi:MAG: tyrosine-type recombinase/integrase [Bdellovibrionales bacterium]|nr:tyrosine-type recombinase/integrase [Bdellovibrionales bacterium]
MYWEKRKDRAGNAYYSFVQWDPVNRRNIRLRTSEVPGSITTDSQADIFCRLREAEEEAAKVRIQRKLEWKKKFYDFEELLSIFEIEAKRRAPNSWQGPMYYLQQYGLDFFLNKKQCNNLNNWGLFFEEFRDWLLTVKTGKRTKSQGLAYSSRNNIIGAVNLFLDVMFRKGKWEQVAKCQKFARHLLAWRNADHVIADDEASIITQRLREVDVTGLAADFYVVLLNTGMRLGEGLSLSLADFFPGSPDNKIIRGALDRHDLKSFGYISLESQLANAIKPRKESGVVVRKPLKGRKRVDARASRVIPILDKETFNILARRFNEQTELIADGKFGNSKSDYLLFDGLDKNRFSRLLREAYTGMRFSHKSPHCARHTFATKFAGFTNADTGLCRLVLGHRDEDTTLGYVHLFEQINRQARAKVLVKSKIALID